MAVHLGNKENFDELNLDVNIRKWHNAERNERLVIQIPVYNILKFQ